jgi:hypothetical protein
MTELFKQISTEVSARLKYEQNIEEQENTMKHLRDVYREQTSPWGISRGKHIPINNKENIVAFLREEWVRVCYVVPLSCAAHPEKYPFKNDIKWIVVIKTKDSNRNSFELKVKTGEKTAEHHWRTEEQISTKTKELVMKLVDVAGLQQRI